MILNLWNPTHQEIRTWAYAGTSLPHPHWEITLIDFNNLPVLIELAGDRQCLNQSFFQQCLYSFTGQVWEKQNLHELVQFETMLEQLETFEQAEAIADWIAYSQGVFGKEAEPTTTWEITWNAESRDNETLLEGEA